MLSASVCFFLNNLLDLYLKYVYISNISKLNNLIYLYLNYKCTYNTTKYIYFPTRAVMIRGVRFTYTALTSWFPLHMHRVHWGRSLICGLAVKITFILYITLEVCTLLAGAENYHLLACSIFVVCSEGKKNCSLQSGSHVTR